MGLFSSSKSPAPSTTITDTDGPSLREPILVPSATSPPSKPSELAPHESSKVKAVIEHFNTTDYVLPAKLTDLKIYWASRAANSAAKSGSLTPLSDKEKFWLTNERVFCPLGEWLESMVLNFVNRDTTLSKSRQMGSQKGY